MHFSNYITEAIQKVIEQDVPPEEYARTITNYAIYLSGDMYEEPSQDYYIM